MCVLTFRLEVKWSQDKSICKVFTCFVHVLLMWLDFESGALERVQIFILAKGIKIEFLWQEAKTKVFVIL